jgi:hypothetical protein
MMPESDVPKTSDEFLKGQVEKYWESSTSDHVPQPDGFGTAAGSADDPGARAKPQRPFHRRTLPGWYRKSRRTPETTIKRRADPVEIAQGAGDEIALNFPALTLRERRKMVTAFRQKLIPPGKPGRKRSKEITAAYADWNAGMRGVALYRRHIPRFERMSIWQRKVKMRALMDAIRTRRRREQPRRIQEA